VYWVTMHMVFYCTMLYIQYVYCHFILNYNEKRYNLCKCYARQEMTITNFHRIDQIAHYILIIIYWWLIMIVQLLRLTKMIKPNKRIFNMSLIGLQYCLEYLITSCETHVDTNYDFFRYPLTMKHTMSLWDSLPPCGFIANNNCGNEIFSYT